MNSEAMFTMSVTTTNLQALKKILFLRTLKMQTYVLSSTKLEKRSME
jgi:hypothetical protein